MRLFYKRWSQFDDSEQLFPESERRDQALPLLLPSFPQQNYEAANALVSSRFTSVAQHCLLGTVCSLFHRCLQGLTEPWTPVFSISPPSPDSSAPRLCLLSRCKEQWVTWILWRNNTLVLWIHISFLRKPTLQCITLSTFFFFLV